MTGHLLQQPRWRETSGQTLTAAYRTYCRVHSGRDVADGQRWTGQHRSCPCLPVGTDTGTDVSQIQAHMSARYRHICQPDTGTDVSQTQVQMSARHIYRCQPDTGTDVSQTQVQMSARHRHRCQPDKGTDVS